LAPCLGDLRCPAELPHRLAARLLGGHAATLVLGRAELDVRRDLVIDPPFPAARRKGPRTREQCAEPLHASPFSSRSIIATVRDHPWVSAANCFRPARVIE